MRMSFSVGVRRYGQDCFLAQALQPPFLSSAGASAKDALDRLREALLDALERSHPSTVIGWFQRNTWEIEDVELDIHRVVGLFDDPFEDSDEEPNWASQTISVASTRSNPEPLIEPPVTSSPIFRETGRLSPVNKDSSS